MCEVKTEYKIPEDERVKYAQMISELILGSDGDVSITVATTYVETASEDNPWIQRRSIRRHIVSVTFE